MKDDQHTKSEIKEIEDLRRLAAVVMDSNDAIILQDFEGKILSWNKGAKEIYGYTEAEALKMNINKLVAESDREAALALIEKIKHGEIVKSFELKRKSRDGRILDMWLTITLLNDKSGKPTAIATTEHDITERKKTEKALQDNEEKFFKAFMTSPQDMLISTVADGAIIEANNAFVSLYGYSRDELLGEKITDFKLWYQPEKRKEFIARIMKDGFVRNFEVLVRAKTGNVRTVLVSGEILNIKSELPVMVSIGHDITKRKKAEEKLKESEEKFRALYDNAPLPYQSLNEDGSFKDVNPTWLSTLGYKRNEIIGKFYKDFLHPDWKANFEDNFPKFKKQGYVSNVQFKIRHKAGHYLDITFEGCIGYYPDGSFKQTYCVFQDITKRKNAEEKLKESDKKLKLFTQNVPDFLIQIDRTGKINYINKVYEGLTQNDVIGTSVYSWIPKETLKKFKDKVGKVFREGSVEILEYPSKGSKGEAIWLSSKIGPLEEYDKITKVIIVARDITERKKAEEALLQTELHLKQAAKLQGIIFAHNDTDLRYTWIFNSHPNFNSDNVIGKNDTEINDNEGTRILKQLKQQVIDTEKTQRKDISFPTSNNEDTYDVIGEPLKNASGKVIGVSTSALLITKRKKIEMELQDSYKQLRQLSKHLHSIREDERISIARDIHDDMGQVLTALKIELSLIENEIKTRDKSFDLSFISNEIKEMNKLIEFAIKSVRKLIKELRPEVLDTLGLLKTLEWQAKEFEKQTKIKCVFKSNQLDLNFNKDNSIAIYRIVQEALTNISKHSKAKNVEIRITYEKGIVKLIIEDDGIGFKESIDKDNSTMGIIGIRERVLIFDGEFNISSEKEKGTKITVSIPY
jgi:PAS domain S-box-containing protein